MKFFKKYWWAFALVIGAVLIYFFMFRENKSVTSKLPSKLNPACPLSVEQWLVEVAKQEKEIREAPGWMDYVKTDVESGKYATLDQAVTGNAVFHLEHLGMCNPTKPAP